MLLPVRAGRSRPCRQAGRIRRTAAPCRTRLVRAPHPAGGAASPDGTAACSGSGWRSPCRPSYAAHDRRSAGRSILGSVLRIRLRYRHLACDPLEGMQLEPRPWGQRAHERHHQRQIRVESCSQPAITIVDAYSTWVAVASALARCTRPRGRTAARRSPRGAGRRRSARRVDDAGYADEPRGGVGLGEPADDLGVGDCRMYRSQLPGRRSDGARESASSTGSGDIAMRAAVCSDRSVCSANRLANEARSGAQVPTTATTSVMVLRGSLRLAEILG